MKKRYKGKRHYFSPGGVYDFMYGALDLAVPGVGSLAKGVSSMTGAIANRNVNEYGLHGDMETGSVGSKDFAMSALEGFDISKNINRTIDAFNSGDPLRGVVNLLSPQLGSIWTNQVNMDKKREELDKAELDERNAEHFNRQITDMRLDRNKYGTGSNIFAAMGAEIPVPGGQLAPVGGAYVAQGNSHEQGGMQLANAEIEGGELVRPQADGTAQIDSARLGTAQANAPLLLLKEDIMKRLEGYQMQLEELDTQSKQSKNRYTSGDVERGAEIIQNKIKELEQQLNVVEQQIQSNFAQQQVMNGENGEGTPQQQFRLGGGNALTEIDRMAMGDDAWNRFNMFNKSLTQVDGIPYKDTNPFTMSSAAFEEAIQHRDVNGKPLAQIPTNINTNYTTRETPQVTGLNLHTTPYQLFEEDKQNPIFAEHDLYQGARARRVTPKPAQTLNINTKVRGVELPIENNKVTGLKTGIASITKDDIKQAGAKVGKLAKDVNLSDFTPYIDNIGNAVLNNKLRKMKVPTPNYRNPLHMETDYNIDGQLAMINQNTADFNQGINSTIGNSAVANAFRLANMKHQTDNTVKLVSDKLHAEMNARNKLAQLNQAIDSGNKALKDAYDMEVFKKKIRTDYTNPSQNLANIEDNIKDARSEKNLKEHQNLERQVRKKGYDKEVAGAVDEAYINGMDDKAAKNYITSNIQAEPDFRAAVQQVEEGTPAHKHLLEWAKTNKVNGEYTIDGKKVTFINGEIQ